MIIGGGQTRGLADSAVDVADDAADSAHHVMVVVADACLVARDVSGGLDTTHESGRGQGTQYVIDRLNRDVRKGGAHGTDEGVGIGVRVLRNSREHCEPRPGDPKFGGAQLFREFLGCTHDLHHRARLAGCLEFSGIDQK